MGIAMRIGPLPGMTLQIIIADLLGGVQSLLQITGLQHALDKRRPNPGQTIRLQLDTHGNGVAVGLAALGANSVGLTQDPQLVLHMMGHLMGNELGGGKIAPRTQLLLHHCKKRGVQIGALICRAIKRTGTGTAAATSRP